MQNATELMLGQIRKSFASAKECTHGGRAREAALLLGREPLDFSASINPLGAPPLEEVILNELKCIGQYPDNNYPQLRLAAAKFIGAHAENIVPGNGSSELIRLFAETTLEERDIALIPFPTFAEYENQCLLMGAQIQRIDLKDGLPLIRDIDLQNAKALFICNPNNPTGLLLPGRQIRELAERCERHETFFLVDEAFIELSDPEQSVAAIAPENEFLFVMRSLTKSFGIPGLRLGFGVTNSELAKIMNLARIPWSIGSIAAAAGIHLLGCNGHLEKSRKLIREEFSRLETSLRLLGLVPLKSDANFILVNVEQSGLSSESLAERTMAQGVLIRDCQSFGLGKNYIRVAVRNRKENKELIIALEQALKWKE